METNNKREIIIGTIGHVDHNKTTLAEAINKYLENNSEKKDESSSQDKEKRRTLRPNK